MARRPSGSPPSYRLHKQSGHAIVSVPLGGGRYRDILLGRHGSPESRREYARVVSEWESVRASGGTRSLPTRAPADVTVNEVLLAYDKFAEGYYVKNGAVTKQLDRVRRSLRPVRELYGHTPAATFGPLALKAVRQVMVDKGWCRRVVNSHIGCVKRCFKWAVEHEMVPPGTYHGLQAVRGLLRGRSEAPERVPIAPVPEDHVHATLPYLSAVVGAMVRVQQLTGMRPAEVTIMRPADIDRSADVWVYVPATHKTEHHGATRTVFIGPKAQEALKPFLDRQADQYCFSPREATADRLTAMRAARKSKVQPSQADRSRAVKRKEPGERYTPDSYRRAVTTGTRKATRARAGNGLPPVPDWHPNQLRHALATRVRKAVGLDPARAILGHRSATTTEVYAEVDREKAAAVIRAIG